MIEAVVTMTNWQFAVITKSQVVWVLKFVGLLEMNDRVIKGTDSWML